MSDNTAALSKYRRLIETLKLDKVKSFTDEELLRTIPHIEEANAKAPFARFAPLDLDEVIRHAGRGPYAVGAAPPSYKIGGTVRPGFEGVKQAFEENFRKGLERDAQLAIYHQGELVVDLWGSCLEPGMSTGSKPISNKDDEVKYDGDTLQIVFSSTKAVTSCVVALAADRGWLRYDDPVSKYWPEFAQNGKADITVADVCRHDAGMPNFGGQPFPSMEDFKRQKDPNGRVSQLFGSMEAWRWTVGPDKGKIPRLYHALTRGWILNQILTRADPKGRTVGEILADELAGPLGADVYLGSSPDGWWNTKRVAMVRAPPKPWRFAHETIPRVLKEHFPDAFPPQGSAQRLAVEFVKSGSDVAQAHPYSAYGGMNPAAFGGIYPENPEVEFDRNDGRGTVRYDDVRDMFFSSQTPSALPLEFPSTSGRASARGLARLMAAFAQEGTLDGVTVLSPAGVRKAISDPVIALQRNHEKEVNPWFVNGIADTAFVNCGLDEHTRRDGVKPERLQSLYGQQAFGWGGFGGSTIWFNPVDKVGWGYTITGGNDAVFSGDRERNRPLELALWAAIRAKGSKL